MKIGFDENVSPKILPVLRTLGAARRHRLVHVAAAYGKGTLDIPLFRQFADDGGHLLISGDVKIASKKHEIDAVISAGLVLVLMPARWSQLPQVEKIGRLLIHWRQIISHVATVPQGTAWAVPDTYSGSLKRVDLWRRSADV